MNKLSVKELDKFANKILEDYDSKNPGAIFKEKKIIVVFGSLYWVGDILKKN